MKFYELLLASSIVKGFKKLPTLDSTLQLPKAGGNLKIFERLFVKLRKLILEKTYFIKWLIWRSVLVANRT